MSDVLTTELESPAQLRPHGECPPGMPCDSDEPGTEYDTRMLDSLLDDTILRLEGEEAFRLVDEIRTAGQALRATPSVEAARALRDRLSTLDLPALRTLT